MKVQNQKVWIPILGVIGFSLGSLLVHLKTLINSLSYQHSQFF